MTAAELPPVVDAGTWQRQLDALRAREKAATRELDAIAAQRRRLPMVKMPDYTLEGENGPVRLADVFAGKSQLTTSTVSRAPATFGGITRRAHRATVTSAAAPPRHPAAPPNRPRHRNRMDLTGNDSLECGPDPSAERYRHASAPSLR